LAKRNTALILAPKRVRLRNFVRERFIIFFEKMSKRNAYSGFLHTRRALLLLFGLGLAAGCGPAKEELVQQKVAERVQAYMAKKTSECRDKLLQEAGEMADSILLSEARMDLRDSLGRQRPGRPVKPLPVPPIDSLAVKPLFDQ